MNKNQIFLTGICVVLAALLYTYGIRKAPVVQPELPDLSNMAPVLPITKIDFNRVAQNIKPKVESNRRDSINILEKKLETTENTSEKVAVFEELSGQWKDARYLEVAAYYKQRIAQIDSTQQHWRSAGDELALAFRMSGDSTIRKFLLENAIYSFNQVLKFDSTDREAKVELASCYIDGFSNQAQRVMQGVFMLRDVTIEDSTHIKANLLLAGMALKSGQNDKALSRLKKVIRLENDNLEAFYLLGEAYLAKNDKENAIQAFKECKKLAKNPTFAAELENYINKILEP